MENIFIDKAILPSFIGEIIAASSLQKNIGAQSIFLGQVRADTIDNKIVVAIEYTSYLEMANFKMLEIKNDILAKYSLNSLQVFHSLGLVNVGEICLFVISTSKHRKNAIAANNECVERIKAELPVWGKEIFENADFQWKVNL